MSSQQARHWRTAAAALAVVRRRDGVTRTELAAALGLRSGPVSDLVGRLVQADLVSEQPSALSGPGRPTRSLHASGSGPLALVLDLRHGDWRLGVCGLDGTVDVVAGGRHDGGYPDQLMGHLADRARSVAGGLGGRVVGAGVAVPGLVLGDRFDVTMLGWQAVDTVPIAAALDHPLFLGNDATMAAVAEARMHPAEVDSLLHIVVEVGLGGALVAQGQPVASTHGMHGEFGHLPFGRDDLECPCGARGCWNTSFDATQISRATGLPIQGDPRTWLSHLYTKPADTPQVAQVTSALPGELGRGIAGLVNALDPALVTLGGLANQVRAISPTAFDHAVTDGLMRVHRDQPPRIIEARAGADATLVGVGLSVFDQVLDADALARWATTRTARP